MMKAFFKKLKSKAGESLIETLAAILIFTMASIVMYTMVTTAANINMTAKEMDAKNQAQLVAVEKGLKEDENHNPIINGSATITFSITSDKGTTQLAYEQVDIYGGRDGSLFTYFIQPD